MSKSNLNGRLLEFYIVDTILKSYPNCIIDNQSLLNQERDRGRIVDLDQHLITRFTKASKEVVNWLTTKTEINKVSRLPDSSGTKGDVTDIRVSGRNNTIVNLSIKNNHRAVKHQRPGSLIQHLGFPKGSTTDVNYRKKLSIIYQNFHSITNKLTPVPTLFRDVENLKYPLIYQPVCSLVSKIINSFSKEADIPNQYQNFLIGNISFYKVIVNDGQIEIVEFNEMLKSTQMISTWSENYVHIDFKNGIKINMRLHTASSRITENISLKFDSQLDDSTQIPSKTLSF
jgi:hypothetical protein